MTHTRSNSVVTLTIKQMSSSKGKLKLYLSHRGHFQIPNMKIEVQMQFSSLECDCSLCDNQISVWPLSSLQQSLRREPTLSNERKHLTVHISTYLQPLHSFSCLLSKSRIKARTNLTQDLFAAWTKWIGISVNVWANWIETKWSHFVALSLEEHPLKAKSWSQ